MREEERGAQRNCRAPFQGAPFWRDYTLILGLTVSGAVQAHTHTHTACGLFPWSRNSRGGYDPEELTQRA